MIQNGSSKGTVRLISTAQNVIDFYSYEPNFGTPRTQYSYSGEVVPTVSDGILLNCAVCKLSLVILIDKPSDSSRGQVHMEVANSDFTTAEVKNDSADSYSLDGPTYIEWEWLPEYMDGLGKILTIPNIDEPLHVVEISILSSTNIGGCHSRQI